MPTAARAIEKNFMVVSVNVMINESIVEDCGYDSLLALNFQEVVVEPFFFQTKSEEFSMGSVILSRVLRILMNHKLKTAHGDTRWTRPIHGTFFSAVL